MKLIVAMVLLSLVGCLPIQAQKKLVGGGCDGCDLMFAGMPKQSGWETSLSGPADVGEPMEISGTIFKSDGKAPAVGVILYVYHTNAKGLYEPAADQKVARRHGNLRGWMMTNEKGQYKFRSIKPAAYPNRRDPAHIHPVIKEQDKNEYYIDEYLFDDDPLLTAAERDKQEKRGGSGIIKLTKNQSGIWVGRRDIVLGKNIPNYQ
ncbi:MAG: intradiol ring-cleavage dioxygenase [Acidobacteria bacterium]|nr:intradiol ring-cleavage dioxygenase [Acidobacteriota bacterium]